MTSRKTISGILLALALSVVLAGCGAGATPEAGSPTATSASRSTPLPTITPREPASPLATPGATSTLATPGAASPLATPVSLAGSDYRPVTGRDCEELRALVGETLGKKPDTGIAQFQDIKTGQFGEGCEIRLEGTGVDFGSFVDTAQKLQEAFEDEGWTIDPAYLADGPTGTAFGLRKDDRLALVSVGWDPAEGVRCPTDFPISACDIKPEQQMFTITVNVADRQ